eukprot:952494-Rhodomonas_salina.2
MSALQKRSDEGTIQVTPALALFCPTCLRRCYQMPGTDVAYGATCFLPTDLASAALCCRPKRSVRDA